jgi:co-chaperonin GroES (HSP10)
MSLEKLNAVGEYVFVIRDTPESEKNGFIIPELSQKKPNTGLILSVGTMVMDKGIKKGKKAVFSKQVGNVIDIFDTEITVLNGNSQLMGVI